MKKLLIICILFSIYGCNQDSPNIKQIENMQFFIDNKKNEQVVEIEPGLQYMIIDEGDPKGQSPKLNQTISAHFHGTLTNGEVFWTSIDGDPLTTELSKLRVFIDPTMAYGEVAKPPTEESSGIPSNSILIFEIELLEII